jgi:hypothetical protein
VKVRQVGSKKPGKFRLAVTLTRGNRSCEVIARMPLVKGGLWVINEAARREAFRKLGAVWDDPNAGVTSAITLRCVDRSGWHTYTLYPAEAAKEEA